MSRSTAHAEKWGIRNPIPEPGLPAWPKPSLNTARRLVWAAAPALGSSGLRSLNAWRWHCADPYEPVDMISGITRLVGACSRRDTGCVHLPTQDLVAQPRAPQQVSLGCSHPGMGNTVPAQVRKLTKVPVPFICPPTEEEIKLWTNTGTLKIHNHCPGDVRC